MRQSITVVTGGSSGLGYEIAANLIRRGISVCIVGRNEARLSDCQERLSALNPNVQVILCRCNVGDEADVAGLFDMVKNAGAQINAVFNVAGLGKYGEPAATSRKMIGDVFEANLIGLMLVSTCALRAMKDSGGTIVNVMSSAAKKGNPQETVYCAAKWGARGYTEALRAAVKGSNIHVIGVYPGGMDTPFWKTASGLSPDTSKFMNPVEVASVVCEAVLGHGTLYVADVTIERL